MAKINLQNCPALFVHFFLFAQHFYFCIFFSYILLECICLCFCSLCDETFYELEANAEGNASLEECFSNVYLRNELFEKENRYHCNGCGKKVNAQKSIKLSKLPPILTVNLQRSKFDLETLTQVKINDAFSFPQILDLTQYLKCNKEESKSNENDEKQSKVKCASDNTNTNTSTKNKIGTGHDQVYKNEILDKFGYMTKLEQNEYEMSSKSGKKYYCSKMDANYGKYELIGVLVGNGESGRIGNYHLYGKDLYDGVDWNPRGRRNMKTVEELGMFVSVLHFCFVHVT